MISSMVWPSAREISGAELSAELPACAADISVSVDVGISGADAVSVMVLSVTVRGEAVCGACSTATPQADRNIKAAANPECLEKDGI